MIWEVLNSLLLVTSFVSLTTEYNITWIRGKEVGLCAAHVILPHATNLLCILYMVFFRYESLRIAYIDVVESLKDEKNTTTYYSKLIKADADGNDQVAEIGVQFLLFINGFSKHLSVHLWIPDELVFSWFSYHKLKPSDFLSKFSRRLLYFASALNVCLGNWGCSRLNRYGGFRP